MITCNKNAIPFDPEKSMVTSAFASAHQQRPTRGFGPAEFRQVADLMVAGAGWPVEVKW